MHYQQLLAKFTKMKKTARNTLCDLHLNLLLEAGFEAITIYLKLKRKTTPKVIECQRASRAGPGSLQCTL